MTPRRWMIMIAMIAPITAVFGSKATHGLPQYAGTVSWVETGVLVASAALASFIATAKGRSASEGIVLGLYLGPLGLLVEGLLPERLPDARPRIRHERLATETSEDHM